MLKNLLCTLFICLSFFPSFSNSAFAVNGNLQQTIKASVKATNPSLNVGVAVIPLNSSASKNEPIIALKGDRFFTLASTTKVITSIMALRELGADYTYDTSIHSRKNEDGSYDLYLKFDGDPTLTSSRLLQLFQNAKQKLGENSKVKKLHVTLPRNHFTPTAPGWLVGDTYYCYASPVGYGILDQNCVDIDDEKQTNLAKKADASYKADTARRAPGNLEGYIDEKVRAILTQTNLTKEHDLHHGSLPEGVVEIASTKSVPLKSILKPILKKSKNLPTDALYIKIGTHKGHNQWGTVGTSILTSLSQAYNIDFKGAIMTDGSGLSRYNALTPIQMARLLESAYYDPKTGDHFYYSLPQLGIDGSLQYRHTETHLRGKFYGKTGSMKGISALAGYMEKGQNTYVVVILMNNFTEKQKKYRDLQDKILEIVYNNVK